MINKEKQSTQLKGKLVSFSLKANVTRPHTDHFHCFCQKLYYFSNFKDFNTIALA